MNSRRSSEVLPEPEGPVRKWNEPGRRWNVTSRSTSAPRPYFKPMLFSLITLRSRPPDRVNKHDFCGTLKGRDQSIRIVAD